jgi:hypothetical protein
MLNQASSKDSQRDIKTRQHLMERSFARAERYGFKRARWRRLWRVQIQEYLTAAIQNIKTLVKEENKPRTELGARVSVKNSVQPIKPICKGLLTSFKELFLTFRLYLHTETGALSTRFGEIY